MHLTPSWGFPWHSVTIAIENDAVMRWSKSIIHKTQYGNVTDRCQKWYGAVVIVLCLCISHQTGWTALIASILLTSQSRDQ